jgi:pimeloyl-ACP methyl ester carboxylesterase
VTPRIASLLVLAALVVAPPSEAAVGQPVQLRTADGVNLAGMLYLADGDAPAVVLVHMFTRAKEDWRPFAERLQAAGLTALAIDLRGHGASGGVSTPAPAMALDVQAAIGFLAGHSGVRGIAVVGASLGASAAIMAAAELPAVRGVALVSPVSDYRGVRIDAALRKYAARPLFLVASTEDPLAARTVRGLVGGPTPVAAREQRLSLVAAHGTQILDRDPDVATALVDWLRRTVF